MLRNYWSVLGYITRYNELYNAFFKTLLWILVLLDVIVHMVGYEILHMLTT